MPVRLQRVLARAGFASRRGAEELIRKGQVLVNGHVATIGMSVDPAVDLVTVGRRRVTPGAAVWIALNKPVGYVVTKHDERGRPTVFDLVPAIPGLTYVGRLDVMTEGLLLLTTDGQAVNRLTHPRYAVQRTYRVRVHGLQYGAIAEALDQPIMVDRRQVRIVRSEVRSLRSGAAEIVLVLTEGRHRIVRRVCHLLGLTVERLTRTSHGPVRLGRLHSGEWRYLTKREITAVSATRAA